MRNSDADAAVYWLARMLEAGEDPLYVARRLVRFASEDIGNADPRALEVTLAAKDAVHFLGMPEANTALAQAVTYLAAAPKSNAVYVAYSAAARGRDEGRRRRRCRCTCATRRPRLMKDLGYGKGYRYAHDEPEGVADMSCLPRAPRRTPVSTSRGVERGSGTAIEELEASKERGLKKAPASSYVRLRILEALRSARSSVRSPAASAAARPAGRAGTPTNAPSAAARRAGTASSRA